MSNHNIFKGEDRSLGEEAESLSLLTVISSPGKANSMASFLLEQGALAAHHFNAHGTVPGHLLSLLGLAGVRRELVSLALPQSKGHALMDALCRQFKIGSDSNGIAYLQNLEGSSEAAFTMIAAVVNEGVGEDLVDSARRSQPVGATILKALGTADHSHKSFDFEIIPQKELVLIISRSCHAAKLSQAIYEAMRTDQPGRGILFSYSLERVEGILDMASPCPEIPESQTPPSEDPVPADQDFVALVAAVDRGHTGEIVESMERSGGTGATILHCRKTDADTKGWYSRLGDLEKEIVLILAPRAVARRIKEDLIANFHGEGRRPIVLAKLAVNEFRKLTD